MSLDFTDASATRYVPGTGSTLYDPGLLDWAEAEASEKRTHLLISGIGDPVLRDTLIHFDDALGYDPARAIAKAFLLRSAARAADSWQVSLPFIHMAVAKGELSPQIHDWVRLRPEVAFRRALFFVTTGQQIISHVEVDELLAGPYQASVQQAHLPTDPVVPLAVDAIEELATQIGVPVADIQKAAGIAKRTYQTWKKNAVHRPRSASEGRLWELKNLVDDLIEVMGVTGVRRWFNQDPERRKLLRAGALDELASHAYAVEDARTRPGWINAGSPERGPAVARRDVKFEAMDPDDIVEPGA